MRLTVYLFIFLTALNVLCGQEPPAQLLKVGIFDRPPFAMKDADGEWSGIAVELWEKVSGELKLPFEYVEVPLDVMIDRLHKGELDVAIGEIGISASRERLVDFTQPFLVTQAAAAIPRESSLATSRHILNGLTQHGLLTVVAAMMGTLLVFSVVLWILERRVQTGHFGGRPIHGFGSALWFSAVTMTTVGYGDKTPQTLAGRFLAFCWMFLGIVLVGAFTGSIASSITVSQLNGTITNVADLTQYRNGVLEGSLTHVLLTSAGIPTQVFADVESGLQALESKQITAFSGDDVTLNYLIQRDHPTSMRVAVFNSTHLSFAMATRPNFPHLQDMNVSIIEEVNRRDWQLRIARWTGPSGG